jgi:predicted acylesterase/phospholipase RssA
MGGWFYSQIATPAEIRVLHRSVRSSAQAQQTLDILRKNCPALVLSGGGGKGAYEVGCIRALYRCGVRNFSAIAGTSVGALNASLIAQRDIRTLVRIWRNIRYQDVMKAHPVGFLIAVLMRLFLAPMFVLRSVPSFWEGVTTYGSYKKSGFHLVIAIIEAIHRVVRRLFLPILLVTGALYLLANHVTILRAVRSRLLQIGIMPIAALFLLVLGVSILGWWRLFEIHNTIADRFALFSNEPLQKLVGRSLVPSKIRLAPFPTYVTLTALKWMAEPPTKSRKWGLVHSFLNYQLGYVPVYRDLRQLSDEGMHQHIIQSAALPEVFPRKAVSGLPVVDGGVADNTPIMPVTDAESLIVVYLQTVKSPQEQLKSEIERISKAPGSSGIGSGPDLRLLGPWFQEIMKAERDKRGEHDETDKPVMIPLLMIAPSRNLGGLLSGTMNFSACKARRLMLLGYWDTLQALQAGLMAWPSTRDISGTIIPKTDDVVELSRAAAQGDVKAQYELGKRNRSSFEDHAEALIWSLKAAEQGHALAQVTVAISYLQGLGTPVNVPEGIRWIRKAAQGGDGMAQCYMGVFCSTGVTNLVPKDYSEAARWYQKGAEQGNVSAMKQLAYLYENGVGVVKDVVEAYKLYTLAETQLGKTLRSEKISESEVKETIEHELEDIQQRRLRLGGIMTVEAIAEAERRSGSSEIPSRQQ